MRWRGTGAHVAPRHDRQRRQPRDRSGCGRLGRGRRRREAGAPAGHPRAAAAHRRARESGKCGDLATVGRCRPCDRQPTWTVRRGL